MQTPLTGSWQSVRSTIPGYLPGGEWLHFMSEGDLEWEIDNPATRGRPSINRMRVQAEKDGYALILIREGAEIGPPVRVKHTDTDEIQVIPVHGFVTVFRKAQPALASEPDRKGGVTE